MSINNLTPNVLKTLSYNGMSESRIDSCCSCSHCNLRLCFELRKKKSCTCSECKQPKKCARLTKKLADKEPYSTNIDETSVKNKINQDEKELFQVTTQAANSTIGNREYATNISKDTNTITLTDNAKSNIAWIKNEINQIKNELCHVITDATNSFTNIYKFTTNVSKDASLTKNVPYPTTLNKNLTINEVNQHEKELSPVINQEENSSIDKRKNTTDISKDISISKNPHATEVNEDLIKNKINELEKEICQVINVDANSSINKRKNIKDISKNISIPKSPNSTKVNEDLIKNEINGIEKEICHVINVEANSSVDKRKNIKDISKNISIPKSPNSTKVNEDLIKNEINDLEKEICQVINVEASSSTDKHKSTKNISNDISNSKNPLSTKVNEDLIKNEINELEKELCHVINKENKLSIDKSNNTTNNSLTDNKPYYTKFNECSIKNEIDQLEKEFRRILSGKQKLFADNSDHKTDIDKDTSLTINEPYPVNEKSKSSCTCIECKNPKSCPKLKKEVADNKFIPSNINEDSIKLEKELCHVKAKEENSYRNVEKCSKDILNTEGKTDSKNMNEAPINQRKKDISHVIKKEANSSNDNREYRKYSSKDISLTKDKIAWNIKDKSYTKSSTRQHIHSVAINYKPMDNHFYKEKHLPKEKSFLKETPLPKESTPPKENSIDKENNLPEKSKLSAQVMNLPFNDFRDSLSIENSQTNMSSSNFNKIVKPDFLTKLKEIYNACSCKVCECISGKFLSTNDDTCDCKPCECDECSRMFSKYARNIKNDLKSVPHSGCPCVSCDRKDCRGVVKNDQYEKNCDCRPCDCVKCWDFPSKPCNCEPCQCTECNALGTPPLRTLIVTPVQGNLQQNLCQCEPCECINCTHNYNAMTSNLRRQVSAEIMTHAICHCERCSNDACQLNSELCRCDMRGQLMMKPNDRASRDYDIHRATVNYTDKKGQFNSHDTIVTYALSSNDYTKPKSYNKSNRDDCQCLDCECMVCEGKRKMLNKCPKRYHDSLNTCKCSYCECDICSKIKVNCFRFKNGYNECDCFDCKNVLHYANEGNNIISAKNSSCKTCYPVKKSKLLTPSMFNGHMSSLSKIPSCISNNKLRKETISMSHFNESANDSFLRKPSDCKNVRACHTESNYKNIDSVYDKKINISDFSELPSKIISSNTHYQSADYIRKVRDGIHQKGNNTVLSKNSADNMQTPDKLCEIFNARKQKPIRDIELLEKYIYLSKMLPKANVESNKSTINSNNASSQMLNNDISGTLDGHRKHVPYLYENMSKEFIYTIPSAGASTEDLNEKQNFNIRHANSSKSIILCDKMSSFITNASHDCGNKFVNTNKINGNNNFQTKYQGSSNINSSNLFGATCNGTYTTDSNVIVDLENGKVNKDLEPEERECFTGNSMTKLSKHNMHKWSKKSKGRKYNKLYSRIMRQIVCAKNITQTYQTNFGPEESAIFASVKKDLSAKGNEVESNPHFKENNKRDFAFQNMVWDRPGTLVNKLTSDNILCKNLDTDNQNNKPIDSNTTWPIMRKNLYLSCAEVAESKGICTIPAMEFNIKTTLKSISLQTSDCVNKVETKNGKQALTRLLIEVNNLLNSPLLQSSHSTKSPDLKEESNLSKSKLDLETINRDATLHTHSMFNSVDKETYCDLIRSMEMLQENITNLMNNVLTNAVYKSELLTTKLNMEQGHTQQLPKINSVKSSCHGFKATFIGLRTISDHTVMVKWRIPREIIYVQGYELQVDGRPIQKIFSPTRCMAILTCLPHSERLLLTIRTLITSNLPFDHQPAATIVYRPRVKGNAVSSHL